MPGIKKIIVFVLFLSIFLTGIILRISNLNNVRERSPDEKTYTAQASILVDEGCSGLKSLIEGYNSNAENWEYPPPTRIGYLWLLATVMKVMNNKDAYIGSYISTTFSILSLLLLILIGLRFFNKWIALAALLFMSVSPMELAIARRTWQDAMFGCIGLLLVYFCCEITRNTKKIVWYILFFTFGSYSLLIKESGIIIYGLCTFWILWAVIFKEKQISKGAFLGIFAILGASISFVVLIHNLGGQVPTLTALKHIKDGMPANTYAAECQSGPWYYLLESLWLLNPATVILCSIGILGTIPRGFVSQKINLLSYNENRIAIFSILFVMIIYMLIASVTPYCQNLRYISPLFALFYLTAGLGLWYLVSLAKVIFKKHIFYVIIVFISVASVSIALSDYQNFRRIFVKSAAPDLSIKWITSTKQ